MKTLFTGWVIVAMLASVLTVTAFTQQEKGRDKKEQQQNQGKKQDNPGKAGKDNRGQGKSDQAKGKQDKGNQGQDKANRGQEMKDQKGNQGRGNDYADKDNRGNARDVDMGKNKGKNAEYGYAWDPETFRDREKIRKQEKVTICHKFNRQDEQPVTINVSRNAMKAHMDHGDALGDCPEIVDNRYSNEYLRERTDYFNVLQNSQEQVLYSRSILDYALDRLALARLQLSQSTGQPVTVIERRQVVVTELENNVSLLERTLGVVATLVANKLMY